MDQLHSFIYLSCRLLITFIKMCEDEELEYNMEQLLTATSLHARLYKFQVQFQRVRLHQACFGSAQFNQLPC